MNQSPQTQILKLIIHEKMKNVEGGKIVVAVAVAADDYDVDAVVVVVVEADELDDLDSEVGSYSEQ